MKVCLVGVGSIVVGKDAAEGVVGMSSRFQRKGSDAAHNLPARAASTGGACRPVAQRSIRMPHFVYLGAGEGLRVCFPWPVMPKVLVVVKAKEGGEKEVYSGVHRLTFPFPAPISFDLSKQRDRKFVVNSDRHYDR